MLSSLLLLLAAALCAVLTWMLGRSFLRVDEEWRNARGKDVAEVWRLLGIGMYVVTGYCGCVTVILFVKSLLAFWRG